MFPFDPTFRLLLLGASDSLDGWLVQVDDVEEPAAGPRDGDGRMGFAGARADIRHASFSAATSTPSASQ